MLFEKEHLIIQRKKVNPFSVITTNNTQIVVYSKQKTTNIPWSYCGFGSRPQP